MKWKLPYFNCREKIRLTLTFVKVKKNEKVERRQLLLEEAQKQLILESIMSLLVDLTTLC